MSYCMECGYQLNDSAKFCSKCGTASSLNNNSGTNPTSVVNSDSNNKSRWVIGLAIGFLIIGTGIIGFRSLSKSSPESSKVASDESNFGVQLMQNTDRSSPESTEGNISATKPETVSETESSIEDNNSQQAEKPKDITTPTATPDRAEFELAKASGRISDLGKFIQNHPNSDHIKQAEALAKSSLIRQNSYEAYKAFINYFPDIEIENYTGPREAESNEVAFIQIAQPQFLEPQFESVAPPQNLTVTPPQNLPVTPPQNLPVTPPQNLPVTPPQNLPVTAPQKVIMTIDWENGTYRGEVKNEEPHGFGKLTEDDGDWYEGVWVEGFREGYGTEYDYDTSEGRWEKYVGFFRQDEPHGKGELKSSDGVWFKGTFDDGDPDTGTGKLDVWGDIEEGSFVDGELHGQGSILYEDGSLEEGRFENGELVQSAAVIAEPTSSSDTEEVPKIDRESFKISVTDREAQPLVRIPPIFPARFVNGEHSGYCKVKFDVSPEGQPFNITTTVCTSPSIEYSTLKSVQKWRYNPKILNGKAVASQNITSTVRYDLQDERGRALPLPPGY